MKSILFIFLVLPISLCAQWNPIYLHSDIESDLFVINADTIITITGGGAGRIYHSFDGGASWTPYQTILNYSWFSDVDFPSSTVGYVCGGTAFGNYRNTILKTEDSGLTWDTLITNDFSGYSFSNIAFVDDSIGLISGEQGLMVKTLDGGLSFQNFTLPNNETASSIKAIQDSVFIVGAFKVLDMSSDTREYMIYKSTDFGISWQKKWTKTLVSSTGHNNKIVNDIMFVDGQIGYAVGGLGLFMKTVDGGENWTDTYINPHNGITTVYAQSDKIYTNLAAGIFVSSDNGDNWEPQSVNLSGAVSKVAFANDTVGYLIAGGHIYKTINGGYFLELEESDLNKFDVYPNPATNYVIISNIQGSVKSIVLYDLRGRLVTEFSKTDKKLEIAGLQPGTYLLDIKTDLKSVTKKIIIE